MGNGDDQDRGGAQVRRPATCVPVEKLEGDAMPVTVALNGLDYLTWRTGR